jgi:hypothetical protein
MLQVASENRTRVLKASDSELHHETDLRWRARGMVLRARSAQRGHVRSQYLVNHATGVEVFSQCEEVSLCFPTVTGSTQNRRSREVRRRPACAGASAQPVTHNPRKQRKNPAAAGSGERFREAKWRRRRDSNPRDGSPSAPLAGVCLRPLGHVSDCGSSRDGGGETRRNSRQGQDRGTGLRVPRDDGQSFHGMMGACSTRRWAAIPRDRGQV